MERLVPKELVFCVRGSTIVVRCLGIVKRMLLQIIREKMSLLNSNTWRQVYFRNASEDYCFISMIMYTGVSSINMAMAAAEQTE